MFDMANEVMPMTAAEFDLLKYAYKNEVSELADFKLTKKINTAREKLSVMLLDAVVMLYHYHWSYVELQSLVNRKFQA
jgi:hypothetical protein